MAYSHATWLSGGAIIDLDGTLFVHLGLFFVAFFVLQGLVFRPMLRVFKAREAATGGTQGEAEALEKAVAAQREQIDARLAEAETLGHDEREQLRQDGLMLHAQILSHAQQDADKQLHDAQQTMQAQAKQASQELGAYHQELAEHIASKLLGRKVEL